MKAHLAVVLASIAAAACAVEKAQEQAHAAKDRAEIALCECDRTLAEMGVSVEECREDVFETGTPARDVAVECESDVMGKPKYRDGAKAYFACARDFWEGAQACAETAKAEGKACSPSTSCVDEVDVYVVPHDALGMPSRCVEEMDGEARDFAIAVRECIADRAGPTGWPLPSE